MKIDIDQNDTQLSKKNQISCSKQAYEMGAVLGSHQKIRLGKKSPSLSNNKAKKALAKNKTKNQAKNSEKEELRIK